LTPGDGFLKLLEESTGFGLGEEPGVENHVSVGKIEDPRRCVGHTPPSCAIVDPPGTIRSSAAAAGETVKLEMNTCRRGQMQRLVQRALLLLEPAAALEVRGGKRRHRLTGARDTHVSGHTIQLPGRVPGQEADPLECGWVEPHHSGRIRTRCAPLGNLT